MNAVECSVAVVAVFFFYVHDQISNINGFTQSHAQNLTLYSITLTHHNNSDNNNKFNIKIARFPIFDQLNTYSCE